MPGHIRETGAGSGLVPTEPWIYSPSLRGQEAWVVEDFSQTRDILLHQLPPALEVSDSRRRRIGVIKQVFTDFAATKLRVDVRPTLPDMSRIRSYTQQDLADAARVVGAQTYFRGFTDVYVGMSIAEEPDEQDTYAHIAHELGHEAATGYARGSRGGVVLSPHKGLRSVPMLREVATELMALEERYFVWSDNPDLAEVYNGLPSYYEQLIVGQELLQKVANARREGPLETLRPVQQDSLLGGNGSLKMIAEVVGFGGMRALRNWRSYENRDRERAATDRVVDELELDRAREKLVDLRAGREIVHMEYFVPGEAVTLQTAPDSSGEETDETSGAFHIPGPESPRSGGRDVYFAGDGEEPRRQEPGDGNDPGQQSNGRE